MTIMDIEWMRSSMTVIAFATFIGIAVWAWSSRKRNDFDVAARSVIEDEESAAEFHNSIATRGGHE